MNELIGKLLCIIGWHNWAWKLSDSMFIDLHGEPPNFAKCSRCKTTYGETQ